MTEVRTMTGTDRKAIAAAIFDPGATEGLKGERTLTEWQTDAVMRVLTASASEPEPVAWRYKDEKSGIWHYVEGYEPVRREHRQPLYANPVHTPDGSMYGEFAPITVGASTTITPDGAVAVLTDELVNRVHSELVKRSSHTPRRDAIRYALSAALSHSADGWQPIESAPKDGSSILLFGRIYPPSVDAGKVSTVIGYWADINGGGWVWHGAYATIWTHWRPLPAAPAAKPEGE